IEDWHINRGVLSGNQAIPQHEQTRRLRWDPPARQHCDHSSSRSAARIQRNDWLSVRKRACMWTSATLRRRGQTLSPGDRADPGLASVRGLDWLGPVKDAKGSSMFIKLTDTQLVVLSAAAQREDRCLVAPPTLKGGAAQRVAKKLISSGLVKEVKAKTDDPVWRRDEESGASYALKLTAAGAKAIVADEDVEPDNVDNEGGALENHSQPAVPSETAVQVTRKTRRSW